MARFKVGDRVRVNATVGQIYDKAGTITGNAQMQRTIPGECYITLRYKVRLDDGKEIDLHEKYLNPIR